LRGVFRVEHREHQREKEEKTAEPAREICQHIRRLRAEKIFRHPAAECRAKAFAFRALHEHDENQKKRHDHKNREQKVNQDRHWRAWNMVYAQHLVQRFVPCSERACRAAILAAAQRDAEATEIAALQPEGNRARDCNNDEQLRSPKLMFRLGNTVGLPASRADFENALREGFAIFRAPNLRVEVAGEFPNFERVAVDLSGGIIPSSPPPSAKSAGMQGKILSAGKLDLLAQPVRFEGGNIRAELHASEVRMSLASGADGGASLEITGAASGEFLLEIARADLETIICAMAQNAAKAQGVSIERVKLSTTSTGPRSVRFSADVIAQKMFMQTAVNLSGSLSVDDQLNARLSDLNFSGGGIIGSLACNFLKPYITKIDGQIFPLAAFTLGSIRVCELTLEAGDPLRIQATFGE
jgi:hypothetical protein